MKRDLTFHGNPYVLKKEQKPVTCSIENNISNGDEVDEIVRKYNIKSGDMIFKSGNSFNSEIVKFFTWSDYSHASIVLKIDGVLYISESDSYCPNGLNDYISKKPKTGVRLVKLKKNFLESNSGISLRRITPKLDSDMTEMLFKVYVKYQDRGFEDSQMEMVRSWFDFGPFGRNNENLTKMFCSEWITQELKESGLLKTKYPSNEYTPQDLTKILLNNGKYQYDEEIIVIR